MSLLGKDAVSHNVHGLIHVADDVWVHRPQQSYSAFPFENCMRKLKRYVCKPEKPLEQLHNRIVEERSLGGCTSSNKTISSVLVSPGSHWGCFKLESAKLAGRHERGPLPFGCVGPQYKVIKFDYDVTVKAVRRDSTCMLQDNSIVKVDNTAFSVEDHQPVLIGRRYQKVEDLYSYLCSSSILNVFCASELSGVFAWPLSLIKMKCVRLLVGKKFAIFPMVHQH